MVNPSLKQEISQLEANFCAALSDPLRLLILYTLNDGPRNVTELAGELGINQPTTSRHLKVLRERGLVATEPPSLTVYLTLVLFRHLTCCEASCASDSLIKRT